MSCSSTLSIDLTSCRGCSPSNTFTYEVACVGQGLTFAGQQTILPSSGLGGTTIYRLSFVWDHCSVSPCARINQINGSGQQVATLCYAVVSGSLSGAALLPATCL